MVSLLLWVSTPVDMWVYTCSYVRVDMSVHPAVVWGYILQSCKGTYLCHKRVHHAVMWVYTAAVMWVYTMQSYIGKPHSHVRVHHAVMRVYIPQSCEGTPCSHARVHNTVMRVYTSQSCKGTPAVTLQITLQWNLSHPESFTPRYQATGREFPNINILHCAHFNSGIKTEN